MLIGIIGYRGIGKDYLMRKICSDVYNYDSRVLERKLIIGNNCDNIGISCDTNNIHIFKNLIHSIGNIRLHNDIYITLCYDLTSNFSLEELKIYFDKLIIIY